MRTPCSQVIDFRDNSDGAVGGWGGSSHQIRASVRRSAMLTTRRLPLTRPSPQTIWGWGSASCVVCVHCVLTANGEHHILVSSVLVVAARPGGAESGRPCRRMRHRLAKAWQWVHRWIDRQVQSWFVREHVVRWQSGALAKYQHSLRSI